MAVPDLRTLAGLVLGVLLCASGPVVAEQQGCGRHGWSSDRIYSYRSASAG